MGKMNINYDRGLSSLPEDAMFEIFLQLRVSDLVSLKLVCKSWHKIITSRILAERHLQRSKDNIGIMFTPTRHFWDLKPSYLSFGDHVLGQCYVIDKLYPNDDYKFLKYYETLNSCDGLVLALIRLNGDLEFDGRLLVFNPMMRSTKLLPIPPCGIGSSLYPDTKHIIYDASMERYKLVWRRGEDGQCYLMEVDTGSQHQLTSSWRIIAPLHSTPSTEYARASVSSDGKLHWLMKKRDIENKINLLTLDVATEKFDEVDCCLPFAQISNNPLKFFGSNGKFYHMRVTSCNDFELWDLRDLNNHQPTWFKRHLYVCSQTLPSISPLTGWVDFICESKNGGKFIFMKRDTGTLVVYELNSGKCTSLDLDKGVGANIYQPFLVHVNSLVSWRGRS